MPFLLPDSAKDVHLTNRLRPEKGRMLSDITTRNLCNTRDVWNGFFKFGLVSRKTAGSVRFWKTTGSVFFVDQLQNTKKTCKLSFLCVYVCAFCILVDGFLNAHLVSTDNLISWSFTIYDHLLSDSVRNVKNVKALREWLKYWLFVWDKFCFEKQFNF